MAMSIATDQRTVMIIEDDPVLLRGLKDNFAAEGFIVKTCADGDAGFTMVEKLVPDLLILDVMLPGLSGFEICRGLHADGCHVPTIMLTARGEESDVLLGLGVGADDYVTKPFSIRELLARSEALLRRSLHARGMESAASALSFGEFELDERTHQLLRSGEEIPLSPKEYDLLLCLVKSSPRAKTREQIMNEVWGYDCMVTHRSIDRFVTMLRKKIESKPSRPVHLVTVREFGYKFLK